MDIERHLEWVRLKEIETKRHWDKKYCEILILGDI